MKKGKPVKKEEPKSKPVADYVARLWIGFLVVAAFGYGFYSNYSGEKKLKAYQCFANSIGGTLTAQITFAGNYIDMIAYRYVDLGSMEISSKDRTVDSFKYTYPEEIPCAMFDVNQELVRKFQDTKAQADRLRDRVDNLQMDFVELQSKKSKKEKKHEPNKH